MGRKSKVSDLRLAPAKMPVAGDMRDRLKAMARDAGVSEDKIERALRVIAESVQKPQRRRFH